jgi:Right handed beta helix region
MRSVLLLATALAVVALAPSTAAAKTLYVDDDGKQCPKALTSVGAAVGAAVSGDTIRVCDGIYRGQVVIPRGKDNLKLYGVTLHGAALTAPPQGFCEPPAQIIVLGRNATIRGLRIRPGEGFGINFDCFSSRIDWPIGILVLDGSALIDQMLISVPSGVGVQVASGSVLFGYQEDEDWPNFPRPDRVTVDRSVIEGFGPTHAIAGAGVYVESGPTPIDRVGPVIVRRTRMTGRFDVNEDVAGVRVAAGECTSRSTTITVADNSISDTGAGVMPSACDRFLITRNHFANNAVGIRALGSGDEASYNTLTENGTGIRLGVGGTGWLVKYNTINESGGRINDQEQWRFEPGHGIWADGPGGNHRIYYNRSLSNRGLDCLDETTGAKTAGTANTWYGNVGVNDSPEVCRAP